MTKNKVIIIIIIIIIILNIRHAVHSISPNSIAPNLNI